MRILFDFLLILSIAVWVLPLAGKGMISSTHAAIALFLLVLFVALIRIGGGIGRIIRFTFRVGLPIASLFTFAVVYGYDTGGIVRILLQASPLLLILGGLYLIFAAPFAKNR
jgi:hypothetical protein